ncbi:MAG TPA: AsmA-like C-terminal region-containing protein, partial [Thermoanaerobaculaceae bacterium]|nr:AsmA-like C-terminal region-containing protein [Thermoanaerobaculaceae bacterium]
TLDIAADLMAQGDGRAAWLRTLSGSVTASSHDITVSGLNLASAGQTLAAATRAPHPIGLIAASRMLRTALSSGTSAFTLLNLTATVGNRTIRLDHAALSGPLGEMTARGHLDLAQDQVDLAIAVHPAIPDARAVPALTVTVSGLASRPRRRIDVANGIGWIRHELAAARRGAAAPTAR